MVWILNCSKHITKNYYNRLSKFRNKNKILKISTAFFVIYTQPKIYKPLKSAPNKPPPSLLILFCKTKQACQKSYVEQKLCRKTNFLYANSYQLKQFSYISLKLYCINCDLKPLNDISQLFWPNVIFERKNNKIYTLIILNIANYSMKQNLYIVKWNQVKKIFHLLEEYFFIITIYKNDISRFFKIEF